MGNQSDNNKRIVKNTLFLYFRSLVLLVVNLYTSRVTLEALGVEDYGIYQVVGGVVAMFSSISSTLSAASQRFITYSLGDEDKLKRKNVFSACIMLHTILGALVVILLEIFGLWFLYNKLNIPVERLTMAGIVMHFSIATLFVNVISVPYNALITAHEKMSAFAYISVLEGILKLGAVFLLTVISFDVLFVYAFLNFLIAILIRSIYSIYSTKHFEEPRNLKFRLHRKYFLEMFAFSGWNFVGSSALVLRNQGIDILLNIYFGVSVNAAKGVANQIQHAAHSLVGNFTTAVRPQLTVAIAKQEYKRAQKLMVYGGKMSFFLMMLVSVPIIICCPYIMQLWLVTVPEYAVEMVSIIFIYLLTDTLSRFLINAVLANGVVRNFQLILGGIKLLAVPITWIAIQCWGSPLTGVIVNTVLQFSCMFGELFFANKYTGLSVTHYLSKTVFRCWGVFILTIAPLFLVYSKNFIHPLVFIVISIAVSCIMIYFIGLDRIEKDMVVGIINKIKKKI